jgi:hypothetical protein
MCKIINEYQPEDMQVDNHQLEIKSKAGLNES